MNIRSIVLLAVCAGLLGCTDTKTEKLAAKAPAVDARPLAEVLQYFPERRAPFTLVMPTVVREGMLGKLPAAKLSYGELQQMFGLHRAPADSHQTDTAFAGGVKLVARIVTGNKSERLLLLSHQVGDCGPYVLWLVSVDAEGVRQGTQQLGQYCDQGIVQSRLAKVFVNGADDYAATEVRNATDYQNPQMNYNTVYYPQTTLQLQRKWRVNATGIITRTDSTAKQSQRMIQ